MSRSLRNGIRPKGSLLAKRVGTDEILRSQTTIKDKKIMSVSINEHWSVSQKRFVAEIAAIAGQLHDNRWTGVEMLEKFDSNNPRIRACWTVAEQIFEMLTGDSPDYGDAEEDEPTQLDSTEKGLAIEERDSLFVVTYASKSLSLVPSSFGGFSELDQAINFRERVSTLFDWTQDFYVVFNWLNDNPNIKTVLLDMALSSSGLPQRDNSHAPD